MNDEKTPADASFEEQVAKKAEEFKLDKDEVMKAVAAELTQAVAKELVREVIAGRIPKPTKRAGVW